MTNSRTLVVGGGIVGMAVAAGLARHGRQVILLERMSCASNCALEHPAISGDPICVPNLEVLMLDRVGAELLRGMPGVLCDKEVLHLISGEHPEAYLDMFARCVDAETAAGQLEADDLACCYPFLRAGGDDCAAALCVPAKAVAVDKLYARLCAELVKCGGEICYGEALVSGCFCGGGWTVETSLRSFRVDVIVNCAGAMADDVARRCDTRRINLMTLKRTCAELALAVESEVPGKCNPLLCWDGDALNLCCDIRAGNRVYLSCVDSSRRGCDEEVDDESIGKAIVSFEERTCLRVNAGSGEAKTCVQSFAADCRPVIGWPRATPNFLWCAAMGDFGPACAMASAAIACDMILNRTDFIRSVAGCDMDVECLCPDRLGFVGVAV